MAWKKSGWGEASTNFEEAPGVSRFNSAQLTTQRLHNLFLSVIRHWRAGEFDQMNGVLDMIWAELFSDASKEQRKVIDKIDDSFFKVYSKIKSVKSKKEWEDLRLAQGQLVKKKLLFLKTCEKSQGLGKAYKDEFEDDF